MISNSNYNNYKHFSFRDFLSDDYFISSVKKPSDESVLFWKTFLKENPTKTEEYNLAKDFILSLSDAGTLPKSEIDELWHKIQQDKSAKKKPLKISKLYLAISSIAAAVILVFITTRVIQFELTRPDNDLIMFAQQTVEEGNNGETQLILSKNNVVSIKEDEAIISYGNAEIKIQNASVQKEDIASFNQLIIPRGKRSKLTLSDGTEVWVNAGTRVVYPSEFTGTNREIYVDGEVYLDVARDEKHPFFVHTKKTSVKVLGTKFNVTAYETEASTSVVLVSGSVSVATEHSKKTTVLVPDQMFSLTDDKESVQGVDATRYTLWIKGLYLFESEDLSVVFRRLSNYYGIDIKYDPALAKLKCSGKLDVKDNIDNVLSSLSFVAPITSSKDGNSYIISKK